MCNLSKSINSVTMLNPTNEYIDQYTLTTIEPSLTFSLTLSTICALCIVVPSEVRIQLLLSVPRGTSSTFTDDVATPAPHTPSKFTHTALTCYNQIQKSHSNEHKIYCYYT